MAERAEKIEFDSLENPIQDRAFPGGIAPVNLPATAEQTNAQANRDFVNSAKVLEPAAGSLVSILDGVSFKYLKFRAEKITDRDTAEEICSLARLSKESRDAAKTAIARIVARRTKDSEAMDITVLIGVGAEWAHGFSCVLAELKKLEKRQGLLVQEEEEAKDKGKKK